MDRAHRLGQKRSVSVFRLISRGTLEEKIMSLQRFKTHVAGAVVNAENASLQSMSTEEAPREHTGATPRPHLGYTSATPRLHLGYTLGYTSADTSAAPQPPHLGRTSATPRLHLGYTSAAPRRM